MEIYSRIQTAIISILSGQLDKRLTYHNTSHTLDVVNQSERIALAEGITSKKDLLLLKTAALFHDTGFLYVYDGHEDKSCEIAREKLNDDFSQQDIQLICGLIMVTKVPQTPSSLLEEIICDADLDYLGRDDFEKLSDCLKHEFLDYGVVRNEVDWENKQIAFFEMHHYFTHTSKQNRQPTKTQHLLKLQEKHKVQ